MTFKIYYSFSPQKNMKLAVKHLVVLLMIVTLLFSCSKDDNSVTTQTIEKNTVAYSSIESEILALVNIHRENLGLNRLTFIAPAYSEALNHTNYMIEQGKTSHDNFDIRSKILMSTTSAKIVSENVAAGYPSAENVLKVWLNSELHRKNIENPTVQYMGISVRQNAGGVKYYTQIFIGK